MVRKMISSTVSLSTIFHWMACGRLNIFLMTAVLQGLERGKPGIDAEIVERSKYRVSVSLCGLFIVLGYGKKEFQHLFLRNAGQVSFAVLSIKTGEDELTSFDSIFFWS
jgi:hypothetical protein